MNFNVLGSLFGLLALLFFWHSYLAFVFWHNCYVSERFEFFFVSGLDVGFILFFVFREALDWLGLEAIPENRRSWYLYCHIIADVRFYQLFRSKITVNRKEF